MSKAYRKRRFVEIYFVLYLAALILLLPGKGNKNGGIVKNDLQNLSENMFHLQIEKNVLNCSVEIDSSGPRISAIDSVNVIYYTGDVSNVQFEFIVRDQFQNKKSILRSKENNTTRYFRLEDRAEINAALFYWTPPLDLVNKTYSVDVIASAVLKPENGGNPQKVQAREKFNLNVVYANQGNYDSTLLAANNWFPNTPSINQSSLPADVEWLNANPTIESIAYERWSGQIFINGDISRDVQKVFDLKISRSPDNNGGTAEIIDRNPSSLTLGGKTPFSGNMKIEIAMLRKSDGRKISTYLTVVPKALRQPEYENTMFPEYKYTIKPNIPLIQGFETRAVIKDKDRERASSVGADFYFAPDISDTGKTLVLERWINGAVRDKFPIYIKNYPDPQIIRLGSEGFRKVKLETRSFGFVRGKENLIRSLEIVEGNAKYYQKFGSSYDKPGSYTFTQFFEIVPKNPDEQFKFKVRAVDMRGKKSSTENYAE